jgi:hypothetical protein
MQLPIDARKAPFKEKYLDEETPMFSRWFEFGSADDLTIHLDDGSGSVVIGLTLGQAEALQDARDKFVNSVLEVLNSTKE